MKHLIIALSLLVATPAFAAYKPTVVQRKDIAALQYAFGSCGGRTNPDKLEEDLSVRRACALSGKLQDKLIAQGFCFYKRLEVGRLSKDRKHCDPLHD